MNLIYMNLVFAPRTSSFALASPPEYTPPTGRAREILDAAQRIFATRGFEGASISEIAQAVGISEGAIYRHYQSKRHLLLEVLKSFYEPGITLIREELRGIRGARARLRFLIWRQLKVFADNPGLCRLVIREIRANDGYYDSEFYDLNRRYASLAIEVIRQGVDEGVFLDSFSASLIRDVLYGSVEHVAWQVMLAHETDRVDIDRRADQLSELLMHGICKAPAQEADAADRLQSQLDRLERMLDPS